MNGKSVTFGETRSCELARTCWWSGDDLFPPGNAREGGSQEHGRRPGSRAQRAREGARGERQAGSALCEAQVEAGAIPMPRRVDRESGGSEGVSSEALFTGEILRRVSAYPGAVSSGHGLWGQRWSGRARFSRTVWRHTGQHVTAGHPSGWSAVTGGAGGRHARSPCRTRRGSLRANRRRERGCTIQQGCWKGGWQEVKGCGSCPAGLQDARSRTVNEDANQRPCVDDTDPSGSVSEHGRKARPNRRGGERPRGRVERGGHVVVTSRVGREADEMGVSHGSPISSRAER